eukprot:scaffold221_cov351-Pavlova_lutheri.AAC.30
MHANSARQHVPMLSFNTVLSGSVASFRSGPAVPGVLMPFPDDSNRSCCFPREFEGGRSILQC